MRYWLDPLANDPISDVAIAIRWSKAASHDLMYWQKQYGGDRMKRREFLQLAGGTAIAWPLPALAQQGAGLPLVAVLLPATEDRAAPICRLAARWS